MYVEGGVQLVDDPILSSLQGGGVTVVARVGVSVTVGVPVEVEIPAVGVNVRIGVAVVRGTLTMKSIPAHVLLGFAEVGGPSTALAALSPGDASARAASNKRKVPQAKQNSSLTRIVPSPQRGVTQASTTNRVVKVWL